ncbi:serine/threonine-protein kinase MRCK alpha-like isoform X2 [Mytilus californianus]|uniref:serine/threonine-protein kinase MRCK alpha-like isoform X2 n=1 Tax=Mytilus californianus TaxID=6549 RepID=UPI0022465D6A|nr:serine/threonine-protein kinase MRCK alpha-like isoform X2 [Mytilus californianus]
MQNMSAEDRVKKLTHLYVSDLQNSKGQALSIETLLDVLVVLYDECCNTTLRREKNISEFVEFAKPIVSRIKEFRLHRDDFETVRIIGRGSFGEVAVVKLKNTDKVFAMKILNKWEMLKRAETACFKEERDVLVKGDRRWITNLHYAFQDENFLYLVMDYYCGGDLLTLLTKFEEGLPEDLAKFYIAEMVLAISSLHKLGYVHRDIKPDNVLIDLSGHIVLADFGSCLKLQEDGTVRSSRAVGTPDYISPEILRAMEDGHGRYGPECDWWSLGVCIFEMLIGETPFYAESLVETYGKIMNHQSRFEFPCDIEISDDATDLIKKLICSADLRFGRTGLDEFKQHPWFSGIDWENIREMNAPYVPEVSSPTDTSNFDVDDSDFTHTDSIPPSTNATFTGHHLPFVGFTFTSHSQISDLGNLQDVGDIDPSNLESLAVEAFERRIKNLDRENTELKRKLQESSVTVQRLSSEASGAAASGASESESRHLKEEIAVLHKVVAESQTEISAIEQELKRAQDNRQEIERKIKLIEEEKNALEKELQDFRDKYKQQSRELKEALAKQKITIEQYTDTNDSLLKTQSKVKELTRELRNKEDEVDESKRKLDSMKNERRRIEKSMSELQNHLEEFKSESSKEKKLRERAEQYTRELEQEIEGIKRKNLGRASNPANIELTQEVSRLKSQLEKTKVDKEETVSRVTSKYQSEISDLKFSLSEHEHKDKELRKEILTLKDKLKNNVSEDEVASRIQRLKLQLEHSERQHALIGEENERLKEEISSQENALRAMNKEKMQLEQEMRDIYDKRESVAQWEAQISEIIKWVSDEKDARGYLQALATKMTEELENLKVMGVSDDSNRQRWRNRRSQRLDKMELLTLQSSLQSEIQAKQQIADELSKLKSSVVSFEKKNHEQDTIIEKLSKEVEELRKEKETLLEKQDIADWERSREQTLMSFIKGQFSLLNDSDNESLVEDDSMSEDGQSHGDSRTNSRSDLHMGAPPDTPDVTHQSSPIIQPEHVYDQPWGASKTGSLPQPKTHHFIMKNFSAPYKCNLCTSLMVGIQRQGTTCSECGYCCHVHCMEKAPSVCPVPPDQNKRPVGIDINRGIGTAYEGYVRVPRLGGIKKGWTRQFVVVCDFKLFLYDTPPDRNQPTNVVQQVLDMRDEEFSVSAVLPSDVIHANKKDIPCILRVTTSEMNPPGSKYQVLMLAESEQERHRWVGALNELHKLLRKNKLPYKSAFQAQEVYDNSLSLVKSTNSCLILEQNKLLMGTDEGLFVAQLNKDVLIRIGDKNEKKPVYQVELVHDEQLVVYTSGRQHHIKIIHQSVLEGHEGDPVKIPETKGCNVFCVGFIRQTQNSCLCVAIKRTIQVYDLILTRQRYRKVKDIQVPGHVQFLEIINDRLCVGYPSCFAIYSVQGDAAPMALLNTEDPSLQFLVQIQLDALLAVQVSETEYFLVFNVLGVYVDNSGKRSRTQEMMWPAPPLAFAYYEPYLLCYSENAVFVYNIKTVEWIQTLNLKKTKPLCKDGSMNLFTNLDSQHIVYFKNIHLEEDKLNLSEIFKSKSVNRSKRRFSFKTRDDQNVKGQERRSREISGPLTFSHVAHMGPDSFHTSIPVQVQADRRSRIISGPTNFSHVAHMGPDLGLQALIELPKNQPQPEASGGNDPIPQRVRSMLHPSMKTVQEAHTRGAQHNGSARPISTASDSPELGHDRASLGESTSSMFEDCYEIAGTRLSFTSSNSSGIGTPPGGSTSDDPRTDNDAEFECSRL